MTEMAPHQHRFSLGKQVTDLLITVISYAIPAASLVFLFFGADLHFGFLTDSTNWDIASAAVNFSSSDPYWWAFAVGLINTLIAGLTAMALAVCFGFALALMRMSQMPPLRIFATFYSDVIRNIPVILQAMFWYATLLALPGARDAIQFAGSLISNRGIYLPIPASLFAVILCLLGVALILSAALRWNRKQEAASVRRAKIIAVLTLIVGLACSLWGAMHISFDPFISWPEQKGRSIQSGLRIQIEFLALVLALVFYRAAYIGEIFRAGLRAVSTGQIEAGRSLGLSATDILFRIRLPQALVVILPPLGSEFVLMIKITSIGLLVGFADLYSVSVNASNLTNRSLEAMLLLVAGYIVINLSIVTVVQRINRRISRRGQR